jgi:hypothetical protein
MGNSMTARAWSEPAVESWFEREVDKLDAEYLASGMTQAEYDFRYRHLIKAAAYRRRPDLGWSV